MRKIGDIDDSLGPQAVKYLEDHGVGASHRDGIWVWDDDEIAKGKKLLADFLADPSKQVRMGELVFLDQSRKTAEQKQVNASNIRFAMRGRTNQATQLTFWGKVTDLFRRFPVTMIGLTLNLLFSFVLGKVVTQSLVMGEASWMKLTFGPPWQSLMELRIHDFLLPALMGTSIFGMLINGMWFGRFCSLCEENVGKVKTLGLALILTFGVQSVFFATQGRLSSDLLSNVGFGLLIYMRTRGTEDERLVAFYPLVLIVLAFNVIFGLFETLPDNLGLASALLVGWIMGAVFRKDWHNKKLVNEGLACLIFFLYTWFTLSGKGFFIK